MFKVIQKYFTPILFVMSPLTSLAQEPNSVWILGADPRETHYKKRAGKTFWLRPENPTRSEHKTLLKDHSALVLLDSGTNSSSGFQIPAIRGHDTRNTEVWMEDILLVDPWMSLPMSLSLDPKAFSRLEIHEGLSSIDVPSVNSTGTMAYRLGTHAPNQSQVGMTWGNVYGETLWGTIGVDLGASPLQLRSQIYTDLHRAKGDFLYYSDNGTPYNPEDDRYLKRQNNDQASYQILPFVAWEQENRALKFLALLANESGGIPAIGDGNSQTRTRQKTQLVSLSYDQDLACPSGWLPNKLSASLQLRTQARTTEDPANSYQSYPEVSQNLTSHTESASLWWGEKTSHFHLSHSDMKLNQHLRSDIKGYFGLKLPLWKNLLAEGKAEVRHLHDETNGASRLDTLVSAGGGLLWQTDWMSPYAQLALSRRPPSLLESFGDGARVQASSALVAEVAQHLEGGILWGRGHAGFYWDDTFDKLVFVEASFGTQKALNLDRASLRGITLSQEMEIISGHELKVSYFKLWALDLSHPTKTRKIPFLPEDSWASSYSWKYWQNQTLRLHHRFRGEAYRDLSNTILVPGAWIWDLSWDGALYPTERTQLSCGISLLNIFNKTRLPISSPYDPDQRGYTGYSDVTGFALPGRQIVMNLSGKF